MPSRPSSSASEDSPLSDDERASHSRGVSEERSQSFQREGSQARSVDDTGVTETNTVRSVSPATSHQSIQSTQRLQDTGSIHSANDRKSSNASSTHAARSVTSNVSANRSTVPEVPKQVLPSTINNPNQSIQIDVKSAQQQYQGHPIQPNISPYSVSSSSYTDGSTSRADSTSVNQQRFAYNAATVPNQVNTNLNSGINPQGPQYGYQASGQFDYHQQQAQYVNHSPEQQAFNPFLTPDDPREFTLNIDYGAMEAYNVGSRVTVESLGLKMPGAAGPGQQRFDVVKALFNQADTNRDGRISQQEFQQWMQGGTQNFGGQAHGHYQTQTGNTNYGRNFARPVVLEGRSPQAVNVLRQSGLERFA